MIEFLLKDVLPLISNIIGLVGNWLGYSNNNLNLPTKDINHIKESLSQMIDEINEENSWLSDNFVDQDVEVEIKTNHSKNKKLGLFTSMVLENKKNNFLLLGEPGSGKSVALRYLVERLIKSSDLIPIYVNLSQWESTEKSEDSLLLSLKAFIKSFIKSRGNSIFNELFDENFERLHKDGRLYFLLDSFDEIPALFSEEDGSELITRYSKVINKFIGGLHFSNAILASRFFKSPTGEYKNTVTLTVQPFSDKNFLEMANRKNIDSKLISILYEDEDSLLYNSQNAFLASLIINYIHHNNELPENSFDSYSFFFFEKINNVTNNPDEYEKILDDISYIAYHSSILINDDVIKGEKASRIIKTTKHLGIMNVLEDAKIIRRDKITQRKFYFSHKRFSEFFRAYYIIKNRDNINLKELYDNPKHTDSLSLYCEICSLEDVYIITKISFMKILSSVEGLKSFLSTKEGVIEHTKEDEWIVINEGNIDFIECLKNHSSVMIDHDAFINSVNNSDLIEKRFKDQFFINNALNFIESHRNDDNNEDEGRILHMLRYNLIQYIIYIKLSIIYGNTLVKKISVESAYIATLFGDDNINNDIIKFASSSRSIYVIDSVIKSFKRTKKIPNQTEAIIANIFDKADCSYIISKYSKLKFSLGISAAFKNTRRTLFLKKISCLIKKSILYVVPIFIITTITLIFIHNLFRYTAASTNFISYTPYSPQDIVYYIQFIIDTFMFTSVAISLTILLLVTLLFTSNSLSFLRILFLELSLKSLILELKRYLYQFMNLIMVICLFFLSFALINSDVEIISIFGMTMLGTFYIMFLIFTLPRAYRKMKNKFIYIYEIIKIKNKFRHYSLSSKKDLHLTLNNIKSTKAQKKILEITKNKGVMLSGKWLENRLPILKDQEANDILAELEEKWLRIK